VSPLLPLTNLNVPVEFIHCNLIGTVEIESSLYWLSPKMIIEVVVNQCVGVLVEA
jgi:hypothetical protein